MLAGIAAQRPGVLAVVTTVPDRFGGDPVDWWASPAAIVVEDIGATTAQGKPLHAGDQIADDLVKSGSFEWHRTTGAEAEDGVRAGRYDFAVALPADFSSALASSGRFAPRQGALILTTNDANNYIARTIADRVTDQVRGSLAKQVGEQVARMERVEDQARTGAVSR